MATLFPLPAQVKSVTLKDMTIYIAYTGVLLSPCKVTMQYFAQGLVKGSG